MSTIWVKAGYGILLGLIFALTVTFGVLTFESGPRPPQPVGLTFSQLNANSTDAESGRISKQIDGFYDDVRKYREGFPAHQRNIFLWFAGIGMLVAVIGVALPRVVNYLRFGLLLAGLFLVAAGAWYALQPVPAGSLPASSLLTLFSAGIPKTLDTAGRFLRFAVSIVGLLVLLFVGLWRLTDWPATAVATEPRTLPGSAPAAYTLTPVPATPANYDPQAATAVRPDQPETGKWGRPEDRLPSADQPTPLPEPTPPAHPSEGVLPPP